MAQNAYTLDDLVFYSGLIGGAAAGSLTLRAYGAHQLVVLLGALGCGMVLGFLCDQIWQRMKAPPRGPGNGDGPR